MSESEPPNGLTGAERARKHERLANLLAEIEQLSAEAKLIIDELEADDAFRRRQPGEVVEFRPRPSGEEPPQGPEGGPCDQGSL